MTEKRRGGAEGSVVYRRVRQLKKEGMKPWKARSLTDFGGPSKAATPRETSRKTERSALSIIGYPEYDYRRGRKKKSKIADVIDRMKTLMEDAAGR